MIEIKKYNRKKYLPKKEEDLRIALKKISIDITRVKYVDMYIPLSKETRVRTEMIAFHFIQFFYLIHPLTGTVVYSTGNYEDLQKGEVKLLNKMIYKKYKPRKNKTKNLKFPIKTDNFAIAF